MFSYFSSLQTALLAIAFFFGICCIISEELILLEENQPKKTKIKNLGRTLGVIGTIIFSAVFFFKNMPNYSNYLIVIGAMAVLLISAEMRQNIISTKPNQSDNSREKIWWLGGYQLFAGLILLITFFRLIKILGGNLLLPWFSYHNWINNIASVIITLIVTYPICRLFNRHTASV